MIFSYVRNFAAVTLACSALTGCFEDTQIAGPVQTVDWYKAHDDDRTMVLGKCANNPGELQETPNCKNALEAEKHLTSGTLKKVDKW
ncbi:hypothetical protein GCM10011348_28370 [Marinobacterium nitratireducens]|uniref:EexN family lipoprotein n=1 Tax=Marinobacterium nitratireducens TaxID=518897 RepID=A0A917ZIL2_9GAMM|nr:EexN family lipoprotein [Marinobacterium nitratireducens]GGO83785.1 hypothetical protein GCM10011348_28370 [Marinobacterium nitratireducens]